MGKTDQNPKIAKILEIFCKNLWSNLSQEFFDKISDVFAKNSVFYGTFLSKIPSFDKSIRKHAVVLILLALSLLHCKQMVKSDKNRKIAKILKNFRKNLWLNLSQDFFDKISDFFAKNYGFYGTFL